MKSDGFFLRETVYSYLRYSRNKDDFKWNRPEIVRGKFGRKFGLVYLRSSSTEVDLGDLTSAIKILMFYVAMEPRIYT